ncbi:MAG: 4-hydroxy-tetrahydrodipicolinate reductase [Bacillota bacterium]|nr:4-hydroxy-tetrahydrodipicolinate reductase [Bacillota bacterium]MDW7677778.1 4-hydroxy-tetrahydrodipicolinate reductase [Bacillota bacterium]
MKLLIWGRQGGMSRSLDKVAREDAFWQEIGHIGSREEPGKVDTRADVAIDFTHVSMLDRVLGFSLERHCPLVIGTTGYSEAQMTQICAAAEQIPLVYASNTAPGMNLLFSLVKQAAATLKEDVDIEVVEAHHRRKPDAPSGTALHIVRSIEDGLGKEGRKVNGRLGEGLRQKDEMGIHSIRGGGIISHHEAWFLHEMESLIISHDAYSLDVFSIGALQAARFVLQASPGLYDMSHVLGLD